MTQGNNGQVELYLGHREGQGQEAEVVPDTEGSTQRWRCGAHSGGHVTRTLGRLWLWSFRWRVEGALPPGMRKVVFIAAPHTSNWDLPFMLAVAWTLGLRLGWMGKKSLFAPPFGSFMRLLGGVAVDRAAPGGLVDQVAAEFARRDGLALAIPPEGTRSLSPYWKSGFYRIAEGAEVPIACGYLDYARRCGGIGPIVVPSGDRTADALHFAQFYATVTAKYPELAGPVRFADDTDIARPS